MYGNMTYICAYKHSNIHVSMSYVIHVICICFASYFLIVFIFLLQAMFLTQQFGDDRTVDLQRVFALPEILSISLGFKDN